MTKNDLITKISEKSNLSKKDSAAALNATLAAITEAMAAGESIQLVGFGTFSIRERAARTGRNPQTKKTIKISATKVPVFKAGSKLKEAVKES